MADVPVNCELLVWARTYRALSVTEAAKKLKISEDTLLAIENGQQKVSLSLFRQIQRKYKISGATLALPAPPKTPKDPKDFRTFTGPRSALTFNTKLAISVARERLYLVRDVLDQIPVLPRSQMSTRPSELAKAQRQKLGITDDLQLTFNGASAFLRDLRNRIESQGIYVYAEKYPTSDCRGFCIIENQLAAIVLNKDELTHGARVFTLAHEYAHILIGRPGISDQKNSNSVERYCNQFAAEFLMPKSLLDRVIERDHLTVDNIRSWSNSFGVSQQSLALRLEETGYAEQGFYDSFLRNQPRVTKNKKKGKIRIKKSITTNFQLGFKLTSDIFYALQRQRITSVEASRILNLAPKYFVECQKANPLVRRWIGRDTAI